jgi:hypothetical protein
VTPALPLSNRAVPLPCNYSLAICNGTGIVRVKDVNWKSIDSVVDWKRPPAPVNFAMCNKNTLSPLACDPVTIYLGD